jgi:hypothetical protein
VASESGRQDVAVVGVDYRNACTGELLVFGSGSTTDATVTVAPRLEGATVQAVIPITDVVSGAVINVAIDMTWTATGPLERGHNNYRFEDEGVRVVVHDVGKLRLASPSGTVTDGTNVFVPSGASGFGFISWSNYGQVEIVLPT